MFVRILSVALSLAYCLLFSLGCGVDDPCEDVQCNNDGICIDGTCNCLEGFSGRNCDQEDLCVTGNLLCENGGTCLDGECDCPRGFTGVNCELIDISRLQYLIDEEIFTPFELLNSGIDIKMIYGLNYLGGKIFYLDTEDRLLDLDGMVAYRSDQSNNGQAECNNIDNPEIPNASYSNVNPGVFQGSGLLGMGLKNTNAILAQCEPKEMGAAKLCRDLGLEWFLPSMEEIYILDRNVPGELNLFGTFDYYWTSTEHSDFAYWAYNFGQRYDQLGKGSPFTMVRAVRYF